jgi:hypothetical protein
MSVLTSSSSGKSSRFAYSCSLGPLEYPATAYADLLVPMPSSCTWTYVELKFATSTGYDPWPIPVVVGLVPIPSKSDGSLSYAPTFLFSEDGSFHQLYSPPSDLLLFTWVTDSHGSVISPRPFTLAPMSHLVIAAAALQTPDTPPLNIYGVISGNVSFA